MGNIIHHSLLHRISMILLDLFCGAGGASRGYADAGFEVLGVDINPQPRYPFSFVQGNALEIDLLQFEAVAIHASPPCQFATLLKHAPGGKEHPNLIPATRKRLIETGLPYIIENVEPAFQWLRNPLLLCGTMFGLKAQGCELQRHRLFELTFYARNHMCLHSGGPVIGVYGGHARKRSAKHGGRGTRDAWEGGHREASSEAMGMDWATLAEMSEAIPPAYTKYIGEALMKHLHRIPIASKSILP